MINWVPNKKINNTRIVELLEESATTNQYTNGGPVVIKLENTIRNELKIDNTKSIVCVSNGTVAIWAAVAAMELYHNKELQFCTQSFTFPASAQGYLDNVIVIDNDISGGIDLNGIDVASCDGIIVTNVFGNLVDIEKYEEWSRIHSKLLIFDNAATSYSFYKGKNSCNYGKASTISFHHTKPIGFGEGGAIIIDSKYERSLRNIINFGIDNTSPLTARWNRKGGNYKMSDIQAAYIVQYMEGLQGIVHRTRDLYTYFMRKIQSLESIRMFPNFSDDTPFISCLSILNSHSYEIIQKLMDNGIYSRKYYNPLEPTPVATETYNNIVCISFHIDMTYSDIDRIVSILCECAI